MSKKVYTVNLPKYLYDWDFDHTGPEGLEIKYVTESEEKDLRKKAYFLLKNKPK